MARIDITERDGNFYIGGHILLNVGEEDCSIPKTWYDLFRAIYDLHQVEVFADDFDVVYFRGHLHARFESFHVVGQMVDELGIHSKSDAKSTLLSEIRPAAS